MALEPRWSPQIQPLKSIYKPSDQSGRSFSQFLSLDFILVHRRVAPSIKFAVETAGEFFTEKWMF